VRFVSGVLYPCEKNPRYPLNRRLHEPPASLGVLQEITISYPCQEQNPGLSGSQSRYYTSHAILQHGYFCLKLSKGHKMSRSSKQHSCFISGGLIFKSWLQDWLIWLSLFQIFSSCLRQISWNSLKVCHNWFLPCPFQFNIHKLWLVQRLGYALDNVTKQMMWKLNKQIHFPVSIYLSLCNTWILKKSIFALSLCVK